MWKPAPVTLLSVGENEIGLILHTHALILIFHLQHLEDCHRIGQTINFICEYDGNWNGEPEERADEIIHRLPEKLLMEAPVAV